MPLEDFMKEALARRLILPQRGEKIPDQPYYDFGHLYAPADLKTIRNLVELNEKWPGRDFETIAGHVTLKSGIITIPRLYEVWEMLKHSYADRGKVPEPPSIKWFNPDCQFPSSEDMSHVIIPPEYITLVQHLEENGV